MSHLVLFHGVWVSVCYFTIHDVFDASQPWHSGVSSHFYLPNIVTGLKIAGGKTIKHAKFRLCPKSRFLCRSKVKYVWYWHLKLFPLLAKTHQKFSLMIPWCFQSFCLQFSPTIIDVRLNMCVWYRIAMVTITFHRLTLINARDLIIC